MKIRTVLEGNAFYEIDEECMDWKNRREEQERRRNAEKTSVREAEQKKTK